jgi:hypothetical protein
VKTQQQRRGTSTGRGKSNDELANEINTPSGSEKRTLYQQLSRLSLPHSKPSPTEAPNHCCDSAQSAIWQNYKLCWRFLSDEGAVRVCKLKAAIKVSENLTVLFQPPPRSPGPLSAFDRHPMMSLPSHNAALQENLISQSHGSRPLRGFFTLTATKSSFGYWPRLYQ